MKKAAIFAENTLRDTVSIDEFVVFTHKTDRITHLSTEDKVSYLITGLVSEVAEVVEVYAENNRPKKMSDVKNFKTLLVEEVSDVLWYITRLTSELGHNNEKLFSDARKKPSTQDVDPSIAKMVIESGKIAGHFKKKLREGSDIDPKNRDRIELMYKSLVKLLRSVLNLIHEEINLTVYQVLFVSKTKLQKRLGIV